MKKALLFLALSALLACSADEPSIADSLVGTWRLTNYCKPNANGCALADIPADKTVFITFTSDRTFRETYGNARYEGYGFLACAGTYEPEGKSIRLFSGCSSSIYGRLIQIVSINQHQMRLAAEPTGDYVLTR